MSLRVHGRSSGSRIQAESLSSIGPVVRFRICWGTESSDAVVGRVVTRPARRVTGAVAVAVAVVPRVRRRTNNEHSALIGGSSGSALPLQTFKIRSFPMTMMISSGLGVGPFSLAPTPSTDIAPTDTMGRVLFLRDPSTGTPPPAFCAGVLLFQNLVVRLGPRMERSQGSVSTFRRSRL